MFIEQQIELEWLYLKQRLTKTDDESNWSSSEIWVKLVCWNWVSPTIGSLFLLLVKTKFINQILFLLCAMLWINFSNCNFYIILHRFHHFTKKSICSLFKTKMVWWNRNYTSMSKINCMLSNSKINALFLTWKYTMKYKNCILQHVPKKCSFSRSRASK